MRTLPTTPVPSDDDVARTKETEFAWHNAFYATHAHISTRIHWKSFGGSSSATT